MESPLFDAHAHVVSDDWETYPPTAKGPSQAPPERTGYSVTLESLIEMMDAHDVPRACLVQRGRLYGFDNSYLLDSVKQYPGRLHGVVMLGPQDPETPRRYRDLVERGEAGGFRLQGPGIRTLDPGWLASDQSMEVWKTCADLGTPVAVGLITQQLAYTLPLIKMIAKRFPDLSILLDHGGMPYGTGQFEFQAAKEAGEPITLPPPPNFGIDETNAIMTDVPNVSLKITEINFERLVERGVRPAHLLRRLVDGFGPDRVIWGSDVGQSTKWTYAEKTRMARDSAAFLSPDEAQRYLHDNAARFYSTNS